MKRQRPALFVRVRTYAQRNPRRYGVIAGVLSGTLFGCGTTLSLMLFLAMPLTERNRRRARTFLGDFPA
ncbi:hypothetical protein [Nocardiopsis quinghaiensis]|uniref:hypothetical protein n=1 Tax=Nocardiopsis quinghaiensis TaxID=464995 RepID=UPI0016809FD9|nr:hypothetical protein [Nocardiopsis quinghaiensis]